VLLENRPFSWQTSAAIQHELQPGVALNVAYFRTTWNNFRATDNLNVTPSDFDHYCITAPVDARLPGGGGYPVCGLYDVTPGKFGSTSNLVTSAENFGKRTEIYNGVDVTIQARLGGGAFVGGGLSTGRTATDSCFAIDSPQATRPGYCDVNPPWSANTQIKLNGAYPLPFDTMVSAVFQNIPGIPVTASYVVSSAVIAQSLGRPLAGSVQTATIDIIPPQTMFEDRITQLDLRVTKKLRVGRARVEGTLDLYNFFNGSAILATNTRFGSAWLQPTQVLGGRLIKLGAQVNF
jgi:hypothetical protein